MKFAHLMGLQVNRVDLAIRGAVQNRLNDDRGEGVISMAIAVLIIAGIGGILWLVFEGAADTVGDSVNDQLQDIIDDTDAAGTN